MKRYDRVESLPDSERLLLARKGFFVRSSDGTSVFCPEGSSLTQKCRKADGRVRYMKKSACYSCSSPCFAGSEKKRWKEIDFSPSVVVKGDKIALESILCAHENTLN